MILFLILVVVLYVAWSLARKPKWKSVADDIQILLDRDETMEYVESYLQDCYLDDKKIRHTINILNAGFPIPAGIC